MLNLLDLMLGIFHSNRRRQDQDAAQQHRRTYATIALGAPDRWPQIQSLVPKFSRCFPTPYCLFPPQFTVQYSVC